MLQLIYCLQLGRRSFVEYDHFRELYETSEHGIVTLSGLMHRTVDLIAEFQEHINIGGGIGEASLYPYLRRMYDLEGGLLAWAASLPQQVTRRETVDVLVGQPTYLRNLIMMPGAPEYFTVYGDLPVIYGWNLYRALRIALHTAILRSTQAEIDSGSMLASEEESLWTIRNEFDELCSSVYSLFMVPVTGRTETSETESLIGLRQVFALLPLRVATHFLQTLPTNPVSTERWSWVQHVVLFLFRMNHMDRSG